MIPIYAPYSLFNHFAIDDRLIKANQTDRENITYKYDGLEVFQTNNRKKYRYNQPLNIWEELQENISLNGTPNYIAMFNGSNTLGNSNIYKNGDFLGIDTTTPKGQLQFGSGIIIDINHILFNAEKTLSGLIQTNSFIDSGSYTFNTTHEFSVAFNTEWYSVLRIGKLPNIIDNTSYEYNGYISLNAKNDSDIKSQIAIFTNDNNIDEPLNLGILGDVNDSKAYIGYNFYLSDTNTKEKNITGLNSSGIVFGEDIEFMMENGNVSITEDGDINILPIFPIPAANPSLQEQLLFLYNNGGGGSGTQGLQGTQGLRGVQGFQGLNGLQGTQGLRGVQGFLGLNGLQGAQGVKGEDGIGINIAGTVPNHASLPTSGVVSGDAYLNEADGLLYIYDGVSFPSDGNGVEFRGYQGLQGSIGTIGFQGVQGIGGTNGLQGVQGSIGVQGNIGLQGFQGLSGLQGAQGRQGTNGTVGLQGVQGIGGTQGWQGLANNANFSNTNLTFDNDRGHNLNGYNLIIHTNGSGGLVAFTDTASFTSVPNAFNIKYGGSASAGLQTTNLTAPRTILLPNNSGTLTMSVNNTFPDSAGNITLSDLHIGNSNLTIPTTVTRTLTLDAQATFKIEGASVFEIGGSGGNPNITLNAIGYVIIKGSGTFGSNFTSTLLSADRIHQLPNNDGTFVLAVNGIAPNNLGNVTVPIPDQWHDILLPNYLSANSPTLGNGLGLHTSGGFASTTQHLNSDQNLLDTTHVVLSFVESPTESYTLTLPNPSDWFDREVIISNNCISSSIQVDTNVITVDSGTEILKITPAQRLVIKSVDIPTIGPKWILIGDNL